MAKIIKILCTFFKFLIWLYRKNTVKRIADILDMHVQIRGLLHVPEVVCISVCPVDIFENDSLCFWVLAFQIDRLASSVHLMATQCYVITYGYTCIAQINVLQLCAIIHVLNTKNRVFRKSYTRVSTNVEYS